MRLAMEYFKKGLTVHHGRLRTRLISVRSLLHYLSFQVYDRGITVTPSYVRKDEVLNYLLDTYDSEELEPIKSDSLGVYEVDNYLMLDFATKVVSSESLRNDLDLLSSYYRTCETEKNLSMYLNKKRSLMGNTIVKPFAKFEYGRVKFRGYNDLSYHDNYYTVGHAKEIFVSHIFYDALADYAGIPRNDEWTFRKELTREQEGKYIMLVLDGSIRPNTELGKKAQRAYIQVLANKTPNLIFEETFMRRLEEIDYHTEKLISEGKQLRGVTDYSVVYEDNVDDITHVPIYVSYYAWDHDYDEPLDDVNRLRGIGGEFTREVQPDRLPYEVYIDGRPVDMYRVEIDKEQSDSSYLLNSLQEEYEDTTGDRNLDIFNKNDAETDYLITTENLAPSGFAYTGDDKYIRALNASDLELNGDAVMYEANMFPKLSFKAQQRSVKEYHRLVEGDSKMELHVKTVIDESEDMYIKQHVKYYNPSSNGEQVVDGLLMIDENLNVPELHAILSEDVIVPLTEDDLSRKRLGVYTKETDSVYAYKFVLMYNVETKAIVRLEDDVLGVDRKGKSLKALTLRTLGLSEDKEEQLKKIVREGITDAIVKYDSKNEFYQSLVTKETALNV